MSSDSITHPCLINYKLRHYTNIKMYLLVGPLSSQGENSPENTQFRGCMGPQQKNEAYKPHFSSIRYIQQQPLLHHAKIQNGLNGTFGVMEQNISRTPIFPIHSCSKCYVDQTLLQGALAPKQGLQHLLFSPDIDSAHIPFSCHGMKKNSKWKF